MVTIARPAMALLAALLVVLAGHGTGHDPPGVARQAAGCVVAGTTVAHPRPAGHCSSVALDNGGVTVFGANFDQVSVNAGLVFVNQRGRLKTGLSPSTTGTRAHWTSRYASVTFNLVGFAYAWAGMNERGLVLSSMSLNETRDPTPDARPPLDTGEWVQYLLDTCATIEEVIATDTAVRIVTPDHYFVADACGHAAAVEFLDGRMVVHSEAELLARALANSTYESSVQTWLTYKRAGNTNYSRLNGSLQRFCLAADRADAFRPTDDAVAVAYAFETLRRIAGERFSIHSSQWSIVFDTANTRAWWRTLRYPEIRYVDLARFDPWCTGPVQLLDIHAGPAGDVTDFFSDYSHDSNLDHMRSFLHDWGVSFTEQMLRSLVQHLESFPCQRHRPPRRHLSGSP